MCYFTNVVLFCIASGASGWLIHNSTNSTSIDHFTDMNSTLKAQVSALIPKSRRKRWISQNDMLAILDYHNKVRANVFPPAANMEYMVCIMLCGYYGLVYGSPCWKHKVWDEGLARSAEAWAATCLWEHGPPFILRYLGQNLSVRTGGYRSILQLVKPWYDEVNDYVFPYPRDCNPRCPMRCSAPMCTHYTQMVWATTNRVGCAVQTCYNMVVWGAMWRQATYLVCNYSPKGNWVGEPPYRVGIPCSACPPSYGGSCSNNLCFPAITSNYMYWFK